MFIQFAHILQIWDFFIQNSNRIFKSYIKKHFPEYLEEMQGIADGLTSAGFKKSLDDIIAWNGMMVLVEFAAF